MDLFREQFQSCCDYSEPSTLSLICHLKPQIPGVLHLSEDIISVFDRQRQPQPLPADPRNRSFPPLSVGMESCPLSRLSTEAGERQRPGAFSPENFLTAARPARGWGGAVVGAWEADSPSPPPQPDAWLGATVSLLALGKLERPTLASPGTNSHHSG